MARWRLTAAHYLNVPGTEVEFKETNRETGKQARKVYPVPQLLNPNDPGDQNYRELGTIIVCYEGQGELRDIIFVGDPTPDMEPLDNEAKAISESFREKWIHPIESLSPTGEEFGAQLIRAFEKQIASLGGIKPTSLADVKPEDFAALQAKVAELAAANAELLEQLRQQPAPIARRA